MQLSDVAIEKIKTMYLLAVFYMDWVTYFGFYMDQYKHY